jgi:NADH-ubiquinone oxidoreductase chain 6
MSYLYIINEYITNNYKIELLDIIFILSIFCGVLVIISKNPIVSVLFLIGLFASISLYLIILGLSFIGLSYLIVYIGAVSILFLFILMLINIRISELHINSNNSLALGITITIIFYYIIDQLLPKDIIYKNNTNIINNDTIQFSTSNM